MVPALQPPGSTLPPPLPAEPEIGFANSLALRVSLLAASITAFIFNLLGVLPAEVRGFGMITLIGAGGMLAVFLYKRRSGALVTVVGGARLGWITGVFCFLIMLVLFTISVVLADSNALAAAMKEMSTDPQVGAELKRILADRDSTIAMAGLAMLLLFVTMSMMSSIGGALGAKYFGQRQSS